VASKQRKILGLERVLEGQILAMQSSFPITTPQQVFQCISDLTKELGHEPTRYWTDPAQMPPPQPPPPDPQLLALQMSAQVAQGEIEVKRERNQIDAGKAQAEAQLKQLELSMRRDEAILRAQVEAAKAEVGMLRSQLDNASKEQRMALESLISAREQERADAELRLKQTREEGDRQVDVFKAVLQSGTQLTTAQMSAAGLDEGGQVPYIDQLAQTLVATVNGQLQQFGETQGALLGQMSATIVHLREQAEAPRVIERDGDGLVVSVGGRPVTRDSTGRMVSIG